MPFYDCEIGFGPQQLSRLAGGRAPIGYTVFAENEREASDLFCRWYYRGETYLRGPLYLNGEKYPNVIHESQATAGKSAK